MEILSGFAMVREQVLAELNSAARLQLTPEQQQRIESIHVNEAGIAASWANCELRKFHSMGAQASEESGVQRLSDAELITQLANQAKELGIEIDLSYRLGGEQ
jgi:hypothetical protein